MKIKEKIQDIYNKLILILPQVKIIGATNLYNIPNQINKIVTGEDKLSLFLSKTIQQITLNDLSCATSIKSGMFYNHINLADITIPHSVTNIGDWAFYNCKNLTSIIIPDSVTSMGKGVFQFCKNLTNITIPFVGGSEHENAYFGYIFGASSATNNASYVSSSVKKVTILEGCQAIPEDAFTDCKHIMEVTIPNSVTTIKNGAFYDCYNLNNITIGNNVTEIEDFSFANCIALENITIPKNTITIGYRAFGGCSNLMDVYLQPVIPPILSSTDTFPATATIHVPVGSGNAYKTATNWSYYSSRIVEDIVIENVTE